MSNKSKAKEPGVPIDGPVFARRKVLKMSLIAGGGLLALGAFKLSPPGFINYGTLQCLSKYEADILYAFAETILPQGDGWPSARDADVIHRMDEELTFLDPGISSDIKSVLMLIEIMPFKFGYWSRFTRLSKEKRLEFLRRTHESDDALTNVAINAPRSMLTYMYYGHESVWGQIGYDGPFGKFPQKLSEQRKLYQLLRSKA